MQTVWILAADSRRARVFQELDHEHHLLEVQDFAQTAQAESDVIQHENELFSKEVGEFLDNARYEHRFDKLHVIAPSTFLSLLRRNMNKETQKLVDEEIIKDISWQDKNEIEEFVRARKL